MRDKSVIYINLGLVQNNAFWFTGHTLVLIFFFKHWSINWDASCLTARLRASCLANKTKLFKVTERTFGQNKLLEQHFNWGNSKWKNHSLALRQQQFHMASSIQQPNCAVGKPLWWILVLINRHLKKDSHSFRITYCVSTVHLLESTEQHYI